MTEDPSAVRDGCNIATVRAVTEWSRQFEPPARRGACEPFPPGSARTGGVTVAGWIVLAVLAVALVVAEVGWIRTSAARKQRERELTEELERERTARTEATKAHEHLETRMRSLRNELADAHQTNAELTARIGRAN